MIPKISTLSKHFKAPDDIYQLGRPRQLFSVSRFVRNVEKKIKPIDTVQLATFNMLAPCYKVVKYKDHTFKESEDSSLWQLRADNCLSFLEKELLGKANIIGLQELWLNDKYLKQFRSVFAKHNYKMYIHQRNDHDAAAILVDKKFEVCSVEYVTLCNFSHRVALFARLKHIDSGYECLFANTHLTFPHSPVHRRTQLVQIRTLTGIMERFVFDNKLQHLPQFIVGDFNVEWSSLVFEHLNSLGYMSCIDMSPPKMLNSASTSLSNTPNNSVVVKTNKDQSRHTTFVSHNSHRGEELGVDHIFFRPGCFQTPCTNSNKYSFNLVATDIIPAHLPLFKWDHDFQVSDHRPVVANFNILSN